MSTHAKRAPRSGTFESALGQARGYAWLAIVIADVGLLLWGAGAALLPHSLPGPRSVPILPAGFEGYSGGSWERLTAASPATAGYVTLLFRMYGIYIVAFSMMAIAIAAYGFRRGERWAWWTLLVGNTIAWVAAMTYDRIVGAIGPFEMSEYLGLAAIYASLVITWHPTPLERSEKGGAAS
jgi:hypothetical protein